MLEVTITDQQDRILVEPVTLELVETAIQATYKAEALKRDNLPESAEVSVLFVDNETIRVMNAEYRSKDQATDVLSFAMLEGEDFPDVEDLDFVPLGDIIVSLERAEEQANDFGHSFQRELAFLVVHGMCHLLGYDHIEESDRLIMRKMEESVLTSLELTRES